MTKAWTNVSRACCGRERRTLQIWRSAEKHDRTILMPWVRREQPLQERVMVDAVRSRRQVKQTRSTKEFL